jgi:UDP-N-acetylglucosamine/UDP-N-acetylgalactosamine 4-epimerase
MDKLSRIDFEKITFLVTGAAGFIGSNISIDLINRGAYVIGIDNLSFGNKELLVDILNHERFTFYQIDILDYNEISNLMQGVDYVLHQAALGSVPRSFEFPMDYYKNNVIGSMNVMEAARLNNVKRVVYASSSSVYGDSKTLPKVEYDVGNVISPYAHTKKLVEDFANSYSRLFNYPITGLRYFNVYGPRQDHSRQYPAVIASFISKILTNQPIDLHGDGTQTRDFTFVDDVVSANLLACFDNETNHKVFNVAVGQENPLNGIINIITEITKTNLHINSLPNRFGDISRSLANITLIRNQLGFEPQFDIRQGIDRTISYYQTKLRK